jgi:hypothetical protein
MRLVLAALCIAASASMAWAQTQPNLEQLSASQLINGSTASPDDNTARTFTLNPPVHAGGFFCGPKKRPPMDGLLNGG